MAKKPKTAKTDKTAKADKLVKPIKTAPAAVVTDDGKKRRFIPESYKSKRLRRQALRQEVRRTKVMGAFRLLWQAVSIFRSHWEVLGGVLLIYALLNLVLVGGINGGGDLQQTKDALGEVFTGNMGQLSTGVTLFTFLVTSGTGTTASGIASAYQTMLVVLVSLVLIWVFRQLYAGHKIRVRDGFYRGMTPLVPFVLVLVTIGLQLLPLLVGSFLFKALISDGLIIVFWQQAVAVAVCFFLSCLSVYWLCSSLFALYVVTLSDMTPLRALRTARDIVMYRRATVLRKLLLLPVVILLVMFLVMIPLVLFATVAAIPALFLLTVMAVGLIHSYMYALYRQLIA